MMRRGVIIWPDGRLGTILQSILQGFLVSFLVSLPDIAHHVRD